ncbi:hypothetical protein KY333_02590 [Candidatus Woesearchaeota archaeon]|nr:hypothetical protein [Candidatus Woesearchaeota archaeon]MBW2994316.1 hypothetical protein [Candidatus Woesearchaeota archaeon]
MKCQKSKIFDHVRKKLNFFQTKGQGLPITTIVIAALAILVLVILFAITTGRLGIFSGAVSECPGICLVDAYPTGTTADVKGVLELRDPLVCNPDNYEKNVYGQYITSGMKDKDNKPIVCKKCCVTTLS